MPIEQSPFVIHFSALEDPRIDRSKTHLLIDLVAIAVIAGLCGIDSFQGMAIFAEMRLGWLKKFLQLPGGAPSHDTFSRVFARIKPDKFQSCFIDWMKAVATLTDGEVVAIDGKTLRHSFDRASSKAAIHMVSAWAVNNGVSLGQIKVDEKSNEITAIPKLVEALCLKGCIVTIDAMGCQREICKTILKAEADYTISLKGNQGTLHDDVKAVFDRLGKDGPKTVHYSTFDKGHGRTEERHVLVSSDIAEIKAKHQWPGLKSIGLVQSIRTLGEKTTIEFRYFINSYVPSARKFMDVTRSHWHVENKLHWVLDVTFRDDASCVRKGHGPENLSTVRRIAINLLKQDKLTKRSIPSKQIMCAHSEDYVFKLLLSKKV